MCTGTYWKGLILSCDIRHSLVIILMDTSSYMFTLLRSGLRLASIKQTHILSLSYVPGPQSSFFETEV